MKIFNSIYLIIVVCLFIPIVLYAIGWWIGELIDAIKYLIGKFK